MPITNINTGRVGCRPRINVCTNPPTTKSIIIHQINVHIRVAFKKCPRTHFQTRSALKSVRQFQFLRELIEFLVHLFFCIAVPLLKDTSQLIAFSCDHGHVVISQFALLPFDHAGHLIPVALNLIPVHGHDSFLERFAGTNTFGRRDAKVQSRLGRLCPPWGIGLFLRLGFLAAASSAKNSKQLVGDSGDHGQIVVGQLVPLFAGFAGQLFSVVLNLISVHGSDSLLKRVARSNTFRRRNAKTLSRLR